MSTCHSSTDLHKHYVDSRADVNVLIENVVCCCLKEMNYKLRGLDAADFVGMSI